MVSTAFTRRAAVGAALTVLACGLLAAPVAAGAAPSEPAAAGASSALEKAAAKDKKNFVEAAVDVPDYTGVCPTSVTANGVITIGHPAVVRYRWVHDGTVVDTGAVKVDAGETPVSYTFEPDQSHTGSVTFEILSPHRGATASDTYAVSCEPLTVRITDLRAEADFSTCGTPGFGPAITVIARVVVNGPVRVAYEWEFDSAAGGVIAVPGAFETTGPDTVVVAHRLESSPFTAGPMRARFGVTSPTGVPGFVLDFSRFCPPVS